MGISSLLLILFLYLDVRLGSTTASAAFNCDFEVDSCGITYDYDVFDWTTISGRTPSFDTGPDDAYSGTYYIFAEADEHDLGDTAKLMLPALPGPYPRTVRLSFWYHMYGDDMGEFRVYTTGYTENLFYEAGDHRNVWMEAEIEISLNGKQCQIMMEASIGRDFRSDIAIDDLEIRDNVTDALLYECDFEGTLCEIQQIKETGAWVRHTDETPGYDTGPSSAYSGLYYIYTEASTSDIWNETFILYMPELEIQGNFHAQMCATFYYHMYGTSIGNLGLYVGSTTIYEINGNQGDAWYKAEAEFSFLDEYARIHMDAVVSDTEDGDIAVDNVTILHGTCPPDSMVFMCNFEKDLCGIHPEPSLDEFNWEIVSGSTPSLDTGPDEAHSGTYYIYIEASGRNYEELAA